MNDISDPVAKARRQAFRVIGAQLLATVLLALLMALRGGARSALSAAVGGGVGVMATAYMAFAVLRHGLGSPAMRVMLGFVVGWVIKVLLTIGLLILAFKTPGLEPATVLAAYVVSFIVYWGAAVRAARQG